MQGSLLGDCKSSWPLLTANFRREGAIQGCSSPTQDDRARVGFLANLLVVPVHLKMGIHVLMASDPFRRTLG